MHLLRCTFGAVGIVNVSKVLEIISSSVAESGVAVCRFKEKFQTKLFTCVRVYGPSESFKYSFTIFKIVNL